MYPRYVRGLRLDSEVKIGCETFQAMNKYIVITENELSLCQAQEMVKICSSAMQNLQMNYF